ncbi:MAG TPA: hypothetical protein DEO88_06825, partial [Syntrophobacteraceae bacterium]|nr:hypothetical protein [Syntrophobacteraceae bacterium]
MKKGIIVIVVLLVLVVCLWGGATYYFGMKTEQQYQTLLQKASQSRYFTFVNQSYERGFLGSKARTVMEVHSVPGAAADNQTIKITLDQAITHGPFPIGKSGNGESQFKPVMAVVDTKFVPSPDAQGQFKELTAQVPEIGAIRDTTTLYLDGNGVEYFVVP